jgi:hypothetical protein
MGLEGFVGTYGFLDVLGYVLLHNASAEDSGNGEGSYAHLLDGKFGHAFLCCRLLATILLGAICQICNAHKIITYQHQ